MNKISCCSSGLSLCHVSLTLESLWLIAYLDIHEENFLWAIAIILSFYHMQSVGENTSDSEATLGVNVFLNLVRLALCI